MSRKGRVVGVVLPVPEQVTRLANRIRRHYDPNFLRIYPHVTVLPPREVFVPRDRVVRSVARAAAKTGIFPMALGSIRSFQPVMPVVFAEIREGARSLSRLHSRLGSGDLRGKEMFPYVPHLTLGQALDSERLGRALRLSRKILPRSLRLRWKVDRLVIVERLTDEVWIPLSPIPLDGAPSSGTKVPPGARRAPRRKT